MPPTVDVHSHVFNAAYLPLEGIFRQRFGLASWKAKALQHLILARTDQSPIDQHGTAGLTIPDSLTGLSQEQLIDHILGAGGAAADATLPSPTSLQLVDETDLDAWSAFAAVNQSAGLGIGEVWRGLLRAIANTVEKPSSVLRWLAILIGHESEVMQRLKATMDGIDLFVHHMMDMESYYPGAPAHALDDQRTRMKQLAALSGGSLVGFVAFDPKRPDAIDIIEEAVTKGFAGVKFYPPNGYLPIGNTGDPAVEERCRRLYQICEPAGVPIFTHCTSGGFEALPGLGRNSDPLGWKKVLLDHEDLRLCLGHAGGANDWISGHELGPYARTVVDLCDRYDNVYCEMGHFEEILDYGKWEVLQSRLAESIDSAPNLGEKLMFGSDWHVTAMGENDMQRYQDQFETVFEGQLAPYAEGFFGQNALDYLNLPRHLSASAGSLSTDETEVIEDLIGGQS